MAAKRKYSTIFQETWLDPAKFPNYVSWLRKDSSSKHFARCIICDRSFSVAGGGKSQVDSHGKSRRHKRRIQNLVGQFEVSEFCQTTHTNSLAPVQPAQPVIIDVESTSSTLSPSSLSPISMSSVSTIAQSIPANRFILREQTVRAEIIAAMNCLDKRNSYNSYRDFVEILSAMAPDSEIIKSMQLGSTKVAYLIAFGLCPYFKEMLLAGM